MGRTPCSLRLRPWTSIRRSFGCRSEYRRTRSRRWSATRRGAGTPRDWAHRRLPGFCACTGPQTLVGCKRCVPCCSSGRRDTGDIYHPRLRCSWSGRRCKSSRLTIDPQGKARTCHFGLIGLVGTDIAWRRAGMSRLQDSSDTVSRQARTCWQGTASRCSSRYASKARTARCRIGSASSATSLSPAPADLPSC